MKNINIGEETKVQLTELDKETSSCYTKPQTIDTLIARITGGHYFDLVEFTKNDVSAAAKEALRYHIDMLEDLYKHLN